MTMTREARAELLRNRVRDCLHDMGHGDKAAGVERFVDHALWCAKRNEMRIWKARDREAERRACAYSLRTLLREHEQNYDNWDTSSAINNNWVLDIWEVACDDWFRVKPVTDERLQNESDAIAQALAEFGDTSPEAVAAIIDVPTSKLSIRLLEAWVNKDSEQFLHLLAEMEAAGL